jgi:hypothetical protein
MEDLPNELVLEIFEYLFQTDVRYLWNISLANRRLHRLAKELIYSTYSLDHGDPALFIRALASSPGLQDCVQDVSWDCRRKNNYTLVTSDAFQFGQDFTPSERRYLEDKVGYGSSLGMAGLNQRFAFLGEESYLGTFLMFTPKVQTITVAIPSKWNHHAFWFKSALTSPMFAHLKKACIVGPMRIQNILPLLLIPSLRTLELRNVEVNRNLVQQGVPFEWKTNGEIVRRIQSEGSDLEHIYLHGFSIEPTEILRLLKSIRSLKTFEFECMQGYNVDAKVYVNLLQGVMLHYKSLSSLSLTVGFTAADLSKLKALKDLEHLRFLEFELNEFDEPMMDVDLRTFLGHLPSQLEELVLNFNFMQVYDDDDTRMPPAESTDTLHSVAPMINTILPALKKLVVGGWDPLLGHFPCQTQLKAMHIDFANAGVEFVSRPRTPPHTPVDDKHEGLDLYALDYVEEDWLWVQWIWNHDWIQSQSGSPVNNWRINYLVSDGEDWVMIQKNSLESPPVRRIVGESMGDPYYYSAGFSARRREWYPEPGL